MIAAIGAFDGFHRGHQTLLERAGVRAAFTGSRWGIITFLRHPDGLFKRPRFKSLFMEKEQEILERYFDIPEVHKIEFNTVISQMSPRAFLDYIRENYNVDGVVVGSDFRFGRDRAGDVSYLAAEGPKRGWTVDIMPILHTASGIPICSSTVREAVAKGDMRFAAELLGYPLFYRSTVIHGNRRGRELGFPTANLQTDHNKVELRRGVYSTLVFCEGGWHFGAANIGRNPTFNDVSSLRFEVNIIDYRGDLYDRDITVFLLRHIRDEIAFSTAEDLVSQMHLDKEKVICEAQEALINYKLIWNYFSKALSGRLMI